MIRSRVFAAAALLALWASVAQGQWGPVPVGAEQAGAATEGKPAIRYERVAGEIVAGTYAGVIGYFVGRGVGTIATTMMKSDHDRVREHIVNDIGIASAAFAIGGTVFAIGNLGAESGDFRTTMVGVTAGVGASLLMSKLIFKGRMPSNEASSHRKWLMATLDSSLPAIGGTIAFNASRKWQR
ncbi:MAG: hypothetical protein P3B98_02865 [Gemmatimonadota bacterium]|nr:hypothetical protein [Gemmatimonadota bacterium]